VSEKDRLAPSEGKSRGREKNKLAIREGKGFKFSLTERSLEKLGGEATGAKKGGLKGRNGKTRIIVRAGYYPAKKGGGEV